jgi:hypothetical protein
MWEEAVVALFKLLSWNLFGGTEKNNALSQERRSPDHDLKKKRSLEYDAGMNRSYKILFGLRATYYKPLT